MDILKALTGKAGSRLHKYWQWVVIGIATISGILALAVNQARFTDYYYPPDTTVAMIQWMQWDNIEVDGVAQFHFKTWKPKHRYDKCRVKPGDWTMVLISVVYPFDRYVVTPEPVGELQNDEGLISVDIRYKVEPNSHTGQHAPAGFYTLKATVNWSATHPEYKCDPLDYPELKIRILSPKEYANLETRLSGENERTFEDQTAREWALKSIAEGK